MVTRSSSWPRRACEVGGEVARPRAGRFRCLQRRRASRVRRQPPRPSSRSRVMRARRCILSRRTICCGGIEHRFALVTAETGRNSSIVGRHAGNSGAGHRGSLRSSSLVADAPRESRGPRHWYLGKALPAQRVADHAGDHRPRIDAVLPRASRGRSTSPSSFGCCSEPDLRRMPSDAVDAAGRDLRADRSATSSRAVRRSSPRSA